MLVIPDIYLNAGGVTVSYFEWIKNLSHVRFGRMEKRFEERAYRKLLQAIEAATGKQLQRGGARRHRHGADEEDLVNSGLEETMVIAYQADPRDPARHPECPTCAPRPSSTRIDKIARSYMDMGIFP